MHICMLDDAMHVRNEDAASCGHCYTPRCVQHDPCLEWPCCTEVNYVPPSRCCTAHRNATYGAEEEAEKLATAATCTSAAAAAALAAAAAALAVAAATLAAAAAPPPSPGVLSFNRVYQYRARTTQEP